LDAEREKTLKQIDEFASLLKNPNGNTDNIQPTKRYTLRGAAIADGSVYEHTYVLVDPPRKVPEETNDDPMVESSPVQEEEKAEWWKLRYSSVPWVAREKVSQEAVLTAASEESRDVFLVYANDDAIEPRDFTIPDALKVFVDNDNYFFDDELNENQVMPDLVVDGQDFSGNNDSWVGREDPPAYNELDNDWPTEDRPAGESTWAPDPGPQLVGDDEYRVNTEYHYDANMSSNSAPAGFWDGSGAYSNGGPVLQSIEKDSPLQPKPQRLEPWGKASAAQGGSFAGPSMNVAAGGSAPRQNLHSGKGAATHVEDAEMQEN
jgi:hypothetical protein